MEIRKAILKDAESLSAMCAEVQQLHAEMLPHLFKNPESTDFALAFMCDQLLDENNYFYIASDQGEDIGYIFTRHIERSENPFMFGVEYLYIDQIGVKKARRGAGCGRRLVNEIINLAKQEGIQLIVLETWSFNHEAQAFFKNAGFEISNLRMMRQEVLP